MPNWFKKQNNENQLQSVRYRALVPIDVWIESANNSQADQEKVYGIIKDVINIGFKTVITEGYRENLQLGDIQKYELV